MHRLDIHIETERLILRVSRAEDLQRFVDMFAHDGTHHIGGPLLRHDDVHPIDIWGQTREEWFARRGAAAP